MPTVMRIGPYRFFFYANEISDHMLRVTRRDGRIMATLLDWYPSLADATPEQRSHYELGVAGVHWPDLDEDLSVSGMLRGVHPPQNRRKAQAKV